ncbi:hypothetical protein ETC05_13355 [Geobacillus sp. BMUD]|nr:hypothetical protein [Geobacillus sp. BMUD]
MSPAFLKRPLHCSISIVRCQQSFIHNSYRSATFSRRGSDLKYIIVRHGSQELFSAGMRYFRQ